MLLSYNVLTNVYDDTLHDLVIKYVSDVDKAETLNTCIFVNISS